MEKSKRISCFISAPFWADTSALRRVLEDNKVAWSDLASVQAGATIMQTLKREIRRASFVCVVIPAETDATNSLFEMGIAVGAGKEIFAIVHPRAELPTDSSCFHVVRTAEHDEKAIRFHLEAFLKVLDDRKRAERRRARRRPASAGRRDVQWAKRELEALAERPPADRSRGFDHLVAELLQMAGAEVVDVSCDSAAQADLSIWLDGLSGVTGNPVLVELKAGRLSTRRLKEAEDRLRRALHSSDGKAGLVIYWDSEGRAFSQGAFRVPVVLWFSVDELLDVISKGQLPESVADKRNRAVHGQEP